MLPVLNLLNLMSGSSLSLFNPLNAELNPICHLLALLGVHHFLHVSRIRVKIHYLPTAFRSSMWSLTVSYPPLTHVYSFALQILLHYSHIINLFVYLFIYLYYLKPRTLHVRQITLVFNKKLNNPTKQGPSLTTNNVLLGQKIPSLHEAQIPTTALTRTLTSDQISPHSHKGLRHVNVSFPFTPRSTE